jgi:hypothetical protein
MAPNSDTRENIITWFTNEFGFSRNAAIALHDVQALNDAQALSKLYDDDTRRRMMTTTPPLGMKTRNTSPLTWR